jgi:hypothetical protein
VLPFALMLLALLGAALAVDAGLHLAGLVWIGRYLGIPGVLLILASSGYSLRKHKVISSGKPVTLLRLHERLAWVGSLLILVHAGIHFNAILGWLAVWAMLITVGSGLTGKFLLARSRRRMEASRRHFQDEGLSAGAVEERLYWDSLTFDVIVRHTFFAHFCGGTSGASIAGTEDDAFAGFFEFTEVDHHMRDWQLALGFGRIRPEQKVARL